MQTQDIVDAWRREGVQQGERATLLRQLRHRFGAEVDAYIERRIAESPIEQIETWTLRVLTATTEAVAQ